MRYAEASDYLYGLAPRGVSLGLARMRRALALSGHPERAQPAVLIAGTNGKGSVAAMVAAALSAGSLRVGLYTSPHLHRIVERFSLNGRAISERAFSAHVARLRSFLAQPGAPEVTFFEACTLLAFEHFRAERCDLVVLEVGLGGRLDATNVVTPLVSVITSIGLDHTDRLGTTISQIAREKAGIVAKARPLVRGPMSAEAERVVDARARRLESPVFRVGKEIHVEAAERHARVTLLGQQHTRLPLPLAGAYQTDNLACAVATLQLLAESGFPQGLAGLRRGLRRVRWPGRLELFPGQPSVLCDAAHNGHAAEALAAQLKLVAPSYRRVVAVFGVMRDKDHAALIAPLQPYITHWFFATPDTPRAEPAESLARRFGGTAEPDPLRAFARARKQAGKGGLVLVAGSIFLMAPIRAKLAGVRQDPPIAM